MSYTPAIPLGGVSGLRFLERTGTSQRDAFADSGVIKRDIAYFKDNIGSVQNVDDLIADRRLMTVALGAFGLGDEIDKKAFVKKALGEGVTDPGSFANRLNNQSYREAAAAFAFDDPAGPKTGEAGFADKIISGYIEQSFEIAVGEQDNDLRLALNFKRRAPDIAERGWYAFLGDTPARTVLQKALNLPDDIAALDVEKQRDMIESRAKRVLGVEDIADFSDPAVLDKAITRFLIISGAESGPDSSTPGYTALFLLQGSSGFGSGATQGLVLSGF